MVMSTSVSEVCCWIGAVEEALRTWPAGVVVRVGMVGAAGSGAVFFDSVATACTF